MTRFCAWATFLQRYPVQTVGAATHQEYWIPAKDLDEFNRHLVAPIEVIATFRGPAGGSNSGEPRRR